MMTECNSALFLSMVLEYTLSTRGSSQSLVEAIRKHLRLRNLLKPSLFLIVLKIISLIPQHQQVEYLCSLDVVGCAFI